MRLKHLSVLFVIIFACYGSISKGQSTETIIGLKVNSLEQVRPDPENIVYAIGRTFVINVKTQKEFDAINDIISKAIAEGKTNIIIKIANGMFRFRENHILRKNDNYPNVSITIEGRNHTILTSDESLINDNQPIQSAWQDMLYAEGAIEIIDESQKLCKLPYSNYLDLHDGHRFSWIQVTEWFRAPIYEVRNIDEKGIYFVASDLQRVNVNGRCGYNVDYDFLYRQKLPRFRIYDPDKERQCRASRVICLEKCRYRQVFLENIHFVSNMAGGPLIALSDVRTRGISVKNCTFEHIRGTVLSASATADVTFSNNIVCRTNGDELRFLDNCENVRVVYNLFEKCGQRISNTFCINCREATYYIANNTFCDFGYGAIGVGVWYGFKKKYPSKGIIEHNEIYFSPDYFANAWKYTLMDSGAIYTWTQNDNVIIRYNYIHDYAGAGDNRGIFCDDGASNLNIYRNVIVNTPNSYCIDSRVSKDLKEGFANNANNFMAQNVVDGRVRFQGHADVQRHVVKGANYVLKNNDDKAVIQNMFENVEVMEEDVEVQRVQDVQTFNEFKDFKLRIKN